MEKTQVYLREEELDALRKAAARSGRSVAELVRDAIRKVVLKPQAAGPVNASRGGGCYELCMRIHGSLLAFAVVLMLMQLGFRSALFESAVRAGKVCVIDVRVAPGYSAGATAAILQRTPG